jgi:hypothetical protein
MRVADTISSQMSKDRNITDKLPQTLLAATKCRKYNYKYFTLMQIKSSVAYIRDTEISDLQA